MSTLGRSTTFGSPLPVTVVVPTLGRETLRCCLKSLRSCWPQPSEVLIVVQGAPARVQAMVDAGEGPTGTRVIADPGRGVSSSTNYGLRLATHRTVLVTHDDCEVSPSWVGAAATSARAYTGAIITGRVMPGGDPDRVPSCKTDRTPHDYTGTRCVGALYPNNMVLPRDEVLALGGFDERFGPDEAAEDCDFCYRWLCAGLPLRFDPAMVVRHNDWRSKEDLERLFVRYARGSGAVYGKHLRRGDPHIARFLLNDFVAALHGKIRLLRGRPSWTDPRQSILLGLLGGLIFGLRHLGPEGTR